MKIAVTGKGGAGKTTFSATFARLLARRGFKVLAIDGDPNPNLAVSLGIPEEARRRLVPVSPDILEQITDEDGAVRLTLTRSLSDVETECGARGGDGVTLLMGAQVEQAGVG